MKCLKGFFLALSLLLRQFFLYPLPVQHSYSPVHPPYHHSSSSPSQNPSAPSLWLTFLQPLPSSPGNPPSGHEGFPTACKGRSGLVSNSNLKVSCSPHCGKTLWSQTNAQFRKIMSVVISMISNYFPEGDVSAARQESINDSAGEGRKVRIFSYVS